MSLTARPLKQYHVFLASPGDVSAERQHVRTFFDDYNRHTAHIWNVRFEVIDWENYSTIGVGRSQELITQQTLEKYRDSLALVIGIMGQRFGSPSGKAESGTEEEFNWATERHKQHGFPEIKWFFRKADKLEMPADPDEVLKALEQWKKVLAFRKRMQDFNDPVFYTEYPGAGGFGNLFDRDLTLWLSDSARPWVIEHAAASPASACRTDLSPDFDSDAYRNALLRRFDKLNFEMLDTTGAFYSGVRLWSVFVPQSVRECHEYNPRLLEIPKEHQRRLQEAGEIDAADLAAAEAEADLRRRDYFSQPLRDVLEVTGDPAIRRIVILGDPGSGKSSLMRYLALRWARIEDAQLRATQPLPLLIDLGSYGRWQCEGKKGFLRFLDEAPVWYHWEQGTLQRLVKQPGRVVMLLDGLDEIFDLKTREEVTNDSQSFSSDFPHIPITVTSRAVGYQVQRLRDAEFRHFMLQDLDAGQIDSFLDHWHDETFDNGEEAASKRGRLKKAIRDSKPIAMLAGNPLLLTMMAILNRHQELPRDRAELYQQTSRVLLHQWDTERALEDYPELRGEVDLRAKTAILRNVAYTMQNRPHGLKGNVIDGETLTSLIEDYLHAELHFAQSRAAAAAVVRQLRERNFILCFLGADSYGFVHRTFLEYFCAADFVHRFHVEKSLTIEQLLNVFDQHCRDDDWREVLRLICGQIDEKFVGQIVERLATRTDLEEWTGWPIPEVTLAIYCLAETRNPARVERGAQLLGYQILHIFVKGGHAHYYDDLLMAVSHIGPRWVGLPDLRQVNRLVSENLGRRSYAARCWAHFVSIVGAPRPLMLELANDKHPRIREGAFEAIAKRWPDETTRELLNDHARNDDNEFARSDALNALVSQWPDHSTRKLLEERAVDDEHGDARGTALELLAASWPDDATRRLLVNRGTIDTDWQPCFDAFSGLAHNWRDGNTRTVLTDNSIDNEHHACRAAAIWALAENWPDEDARKLLRDRAVQDDHEDPRGVAIQWLAWSWPDETTRTLLAERAVKDEHPDPRGTALHALGEKWPDDTTRKLLAERAIQDTDDDTRCAALWTLAKKWPDETTRKLLAERVRVDGFAASVFGGQHSEFGRIVLTRDLDGAHPYLDPTKPISREHIERAAKVAGVAVERIDETLRSLSKHLGWDITCGGTP